MRVPAALTAKQRSACGLLVLGFLALALQAMLGMGLKHHRPAAGQSLVFEICTTQGLVKIPVAADKSSPADDGNHRCCDLCGVSSPPLASQRAPQVALLARPSPEQFPRNLSVRAQTHSWAHPPRGPPTPA